MKQIYSCERIVDTVTVSMDIGTAEALTAILATVVDMRDSYGKGDIEDLLESLWDEGEVRSPSPLYAAFGGVYLSDAL